MQTSKYAVAYVFAGHSLQPLLQSVQLVAPTPLRVPLEHSEQDVEPAAAEKESSGQYLHAVRSGSAYVPGAQGEHESEPRGEKVPCGHAWHVLEEASRKVPAEHTAHSGSGRWLKGSMSK